MAATSESEFCRLRSVISIRFVVVQLVVCLRLVRAADEVTPASAGAILSTSTASLSPSSTTSSSSSSSLSLSSSSSSSSSSSFYDDRRPHTDLSFVDYSEYDADELFGVYDESSSDYMNVDYDYVSDSGTPWNAEESRSRAAGHRSDHEDIQSEPPLGAASLTFVFDVTGSMHDDLVQVIEGAARILATTLAMREKPLYNYVLVPFHDPG